MKYKNSHNKINKKQINKNKQEINYLKHKNINKRYQNIKKD